MLMAGEPPGVDGQWLVTAGRFHVFPAEGGAAVVPARDAGIGRTSWLLLHGRDFEEVVEQVKGAIRR